jgi:hypothetical protein
MHPHKAQAHSSSRDKFKAITGHAGGGHSHAGSSHLKKAGKDGVLKTWSGHHKAHRAEERAHGGRAKPRADGYARGGHAKGKGPHNVTINVVQRPPGGGGMAARPPVPPPPAPGAGGAPPPGGAPPMPPMGSGAPAPPGTANPMAALNKGMGGMGFAKGGKVRSGRGSVGSHKGDATIPRQGDAKYDLAGWRKYAQTDREKRLSGKAGHVQAYTKRLGDDGSIDVQPTKSGRTTLARGGGAGMKYGAQSGMGRLEQFERERKRHGHSRL